MPVFGIGNCCCGSCRDCGPETCGTTFRLGRLNAWTHGWREFTTAPLNPSDEAPYTALHWQVAPWRVGLTPGGVTGIIHSPPYSTFQNSGNLYFEPVPWCRHATVVQILNVQSDNVWADQGVFDKVNDAGDWPTSLPVIGTDWQQHLGPNDDARVHYRVDWGNAVCKLRYSRGDIVQWYNQDAAALAVSEVDYRYRRTPFSSAVTQWEYGSARRFPLAPEQWTQPYHDPPHFERQGTSYLMWRERISVRPVTMTFNLYRRPGGDLQVNFTDNEDGTFSARTHNPGTILTTTRAEWHRTFTADELTGIVTSEVVQDQKATSTSFPTSIVWNRADLNPDLFPGVDARFSQVRTLSAHVIGPEMAAGVDLLQYGGMAADTRGATVYRVGTPGVRRVASPTRVEWENGTIGPLLWGEFLAWAYDPVANQYYYDFQRRVTYHVTFTADVEYVQLENPTSANAVMALTAPLLREVGYGSHWRVRSDGEVQVLVAGPIDGTNQTFGGACTPRADWQEKENLKLTQTRLDLERASWSFTVSGQCKHVEPALPSEDADWVCQSLAGFMNTYRDGAALNVFAVQNGMEIMVEPEDGPGIRTQAYTVETGRVLCRGPVP